MIKDTHTLYVYIYSVHLNVFQGSLELDTIFLLYTTCMLLLHMCTRHTLVPTADPCAQTEVSIYLMPAWIKEVVLY